MCSSHSFWKHLLLTMKTCWSLRDTCYTSRNYVKDGTNSHVISQDSFIVIHNRAESAKHSFIRTLVLVSLVHFASLEILWIIEIVWVLKMKKKNNYTKICVNIVQAFSCTKKLFLIYLVSIQFPPYVGPSATFLHALGINYIPRTRNKLFTDVLIAIISQFLWKPIRSVLLIKVWNTPKVSIQYLNIQSDKWVNLILSSKPNLPSYSSVSGGSWLPQHCWLPWLWCGRRQGGCCFAFLLLIGEAIEENPPRRVNMAFVIVSSGSSGNLRSFTAPSADMLPFTDRLFPWNLETGPKSLVALDSVGRAQHCSAWEARAAVLQTGGFQQRIHPGEDGESNRQLDRGCGSYHAANALWIGVKGFGA